MPQHVPLGAFGDSDVGVHVRGADLDPGTCRRPEVAEPLRLPFGPAARSGNGVVGAVWEERDRNRPREPRVAARDGEQPAGCASAPAPDTSVQSPGRATLQPLTPP